MLAKSVSLILHVLNDLQSDAETDQVILAWLSAMLSLLFTRQSVLTQKRTSTRKNRLHYLPVRGADFETLKLR